MRIRFDELEGFIRVYAVLCGPEDYDAIYKTIRYVNRQKSGITYVFSHNYAKIKTDSYDYLPLGKMLNLCNVIILMKSVCNRNKNQYHYYVILEKCSYK